MVLVERVVNWRDDSQLKIPPAQLSVIVNSIVQMPSSCSGFVLLRPNGQTAPLMQYDTFFADVPVDEVRRGIRRYRTC